MAAHEDDLAYLWDMLQAARDAVEFVTGKRRDEWDADKVTRLAVERTVEIVGEAARHVSDRTRVNHPEIPWRQIVGLRHLLAHEYGQIDYARLFDTVIRDIPELIKNLVALLPPDAET
jgi:uncharacterized protein with HEPN domain